MAIESTKPQLFVPCIDSHTLISTLALKDDISSLLCAYRPIQKAFFSLLMISSLFGIGLALCREMSKFGWSRISVVLDFTWHVIPLCHEFAFYRFCLFIVYTEL